MVDHHHWWLNGKISNGGGCYGGVVSVRGDVAELLIVPFSCYVEATRSWASFFFEIVFPPFFFHHSAMNQPFISPRQKLAIYL